MGSLGETTAEALNSAHRAFCDPDADVSNIYMTGKDVDLNAPAFDRGHPIVGLLALEFGDVGCAIALAARLFVEGPLSHYAVHTYLAALVLNEKLAEASSVAPSWLMRFRRTSLPGSWRRARSTFLSSPRLA